MYAWLILVYIVYLSISALLEIRAREGDNKKTKPISSYVWIIFIILNVPLSRILDNVDKLIENIYLIDDYHFITK